MIWLHTNRGEFCPLQFLSSIVTAANALLCTEHRPSGRRKRRQIAKIVMLPPLHCDVFDKMSKETCCSLLNFLIGQSQLFCSALVQSRKCRSRKTWSVFGTVTWRFVGRWEPAWVHQNPQDETSGSLPPRLRQENPSEDGGSRHV